MRRNKVFPFSLYNTIQSVSLQLTLEIRTKNMANPVAVISMGGVVAGHKTFIRFTFRVRKVSLIDG